jgi:hypothetical protein
MFEIALDMAPGPGSIAKQYKGTKSQSVRLIKTFSVPDGSQITISYTMSVTISKVSL